jgi:hypothetical protein
VAVNTAIDQLRPDDGRALAVGRLDRVLVAAGGLALRITVSDGRVKTLPPAAM